MLVSLHQTDSLFFVAGPYSHNTYVPTSATAGLFVIGRHWLIKSVWVGIWLLISCLSGKFDMLWL